MSSGRHGRQVSADGIHGIVAFEYANAAARTGATGFQPYDVNKIALQQDDGSLWLLSAVTPTWTQITTGAGGGGGDNVSVNGTASADANFSDSTPAPPEDGINVRWQKDASAPDNVSANVPLTAEHFIITNRIFGGL